MSKESSDGKVSISDKSSEQLSQSVPDSRKSPDSNAQTTSNSQPAQDSDNDAAAADASSDDAGDNTDEDSYESADTAEMLYSIRNSYSEKHGVDKQIEDLIRSQSSSSIFVYRKTPRDVGNNIIDNWLLSSFEDRVYSMVIAPSFIIISPVTVKLEPDVNRLLTITNSDYPMLANSDLELIGSSYTNFVIPESVMAYIKETCYDITTLPEYVFLPESFSSFNYFVFFLALLGFSILVFMVYKVIVWAFMLDQNKENDMKKGDNSEVASPLNTGSYNMCIFPSDFDDTQQYDRL